MIATSLFRAAAVALMLLGTSPGCYWVLYAALIAESSGGVLYVLAVRARTPTIVGTGTLLSSANSLNAVTGGAMQLIGGPLGGILLTLSGINWLICADALSYLLSAGTMFMTSRTDRERTGHKAAIAGVARDLIGGVHVLFRQPVARALPAAVAIGMFGSMSEVIPQTTMQRVIPNAVLGRVSAVFLTGEAAATLTGAVAGPFLAQAAQFTGVATAASLVTLSAAALTWLIVPRMARIPRAFRGSREPPPHPLALSMG